MPAWHDMLQEAPAGENVHLFLEKLQSSYSSGSVSRLNRGV